MSHSRERNEANCLNCDTEVIGRYCHVCGQENVEPRESFWSLITHFFNDITHFDGKFFKTVGNLLAKPGFLPSEYMKGRRARYLHPIRMYLFTSALFFFIFYTYTSDTLIEISDSGASTVNGSTVARDTVDVNIFDMKYATVQAYDSTQKTLPVDARDNWIERKLMRRFISMNSRYQNDLRGFLKAMIDGFVHSFPSLLFVSLPLFALVLKLLYSRRNYVYADHAIYLVFLYIAAFILGLLYILFDRTAKLLHAPVIYILVFAVVAYGFVYSVMSMKRFYSQGWFKTIIKYILFNLLATIIIIVLFVIFLLLTFFRV